MYPAWAHRLSILCLFQKLEKANAKTLRLVGCKTWFHLFGLRRCSTIFGPRYVVRPFLYLSSLGLQVAFATSLVEGPKLAWHIFITSFLTLLWGLASLKVLPWTNVVAFVSQTIFKTIVTLNKIYALVYIIQWFHSYAFSNSWVLRQNETDVKSLFYRTWKSNILWQFWTTYRHFEG